MTTVLRHVTVTAIAVVLVGCETPTRSGPNSTKRVDYKLPTLTPVEPGKQDQEQEGIRISVAAYPYSTKQTVSQEWRPVPAVPLRPDHHPVQLRETPSLEVDPTNVAFKVKIYNRQERVLRLAGAVVQFQVEGKTAAVDPEAHYDKFLTGIILPRQEGNYNISGPDLGSLADDATIALLLYDIVIATDAAGNPTKRGNFEFFYKLSRQAKTQELPVTERRVYLTDNGYARLRQRSSGQWVAMPELANEINAH